MFRKTTTALAAVLMIGSASVALADDSYSFDGRQNPIIEGGSADLQPLLVNVAWRRHHSFVSRRAALRGYYGRGASSGSWLNRASQERDGGW